MTRTWTVALLCGKKASDFFFIIAIFLGGVWIIAPQSHTLVCWITLLSKTPWVITYLRDFFHGIKKGEISYNNFLSLIYSTFILTVVNWGRKVQILTHYFDIKKERMLSVHIAKVIILYLIWKKRRTHSSNITAVLTCLKMPKPVYKYCFPQIRSIRRQTAALRKVFHQTQNIWPQRLQREQSSEKYLTSFPQALFTDDQCKTDVCKFCQSND